jgi:DNA-binding response OmpR family regulator
MRACRILLIDDDQYVRGIVSAAICSVLNYEVDEAADPEQARDLLKSQSYALVLTDLSFTAGRLEGLDLIREISAMPLRPRIVAMSGAQTSAASALDAGADAFLAKPMNLSGLISTLRLVLEKPAG